MAGKPTPTVPLVVTDHAFGLLLAIFHHVYTRGTPIRRRSVRDVIRRSGAPLTGISPENLRAAGVERGARLAGTRDGQPVLEDGRVLTVAAVLWATGFRDDFTWIEGLPLDNDGCHGTHAESPGTGPGSASWACPFSSG